MFQIVSKRPDRFGRTLFYNGGHWSDRQPCGFAYFTAAAAKGVITRKRLDGEVVPQTRADEILAANATLKPSRRT